MLDYHLLIFLSFFKFINFLFKNINVTDHVIIQILFSYCVIKRLFFVAKCHLTSVFLMPNILVAGDAAAASVAPKRGHFGIPLVNGGQVFTLVGRWRFGHFRRGSR
jgi:hypothetical protein